MKYIMHIGLHGMENVKSVTEAYITFLYIVTT